MVILLQLFMIDNCADDWRIAMTWQRMMQIGKREREIIFIIFISFTQKYFCQFHSKIFQVWNCWFVPSIQCREDSTSSGPRSFLTTGARLAPSGSLWMLLLVYQCSSGQNYFCLLSRVLQDPLQVRDEARDL